LAGYNNIPLMQPLQFAYILQQIRESSADILKVKVRRLLEVGCGEGKFLRCVLNKAERIFGVDIKTLPKNPENDFPQVLFAYADIRFLPFKDSIFDVVFCINVLTELSFKRVKNGLREMIRISKGEVIVQVQDSANPVLLVRTLLRKMRRYYGKPLIYSKSKIRNLIRWAGGKVVNVFPVTISPVLHGHFFNLLRALHNFLADVTGLSKSAVVVYQINVQRGRSGTIFT
jgi:ubiquinone/menaquinone biosynthesis C-methylase UbiE